MMYFCRKMYTIETGSANMIANALNSDHGVWVANWPTIPLSATARVNCFASDRKMTEK